VHDVQRTRPALRLERNPLVLVLGQVRIASILQLTAYIPAIQDRLRKQGFPRFSQDAMQVLQLPVASSIPDAPWEVRYHFGTADRRGEVVLSTNAVTYVVTEYDTFEHWVEKWEGILRIVSSEMDIALGERAGLRYVDIVAEDDPTRQVEENLKPGLRGLSELELSDVQSRFEIRGKTAAGELIVKATRPRAGGIPEDLQPLDLDIPRLSTLPERQYVVLDFDHFSTTVRPFDIPGLIGHFWDLHDVVDLAFRASVTKEALDSWQA
jgi:uncharacterized protein (TIGR04255 family)